MNCFECAKANDTVPAVAVCDHCGVGLCLDHLVEASKYRVGGTLWDCPHNLPAVKPLRSVPAGIAHGARHTQLPPGDSAHRVAALIEEPRLANELALMAKALGHPARVQILRVLLARESCFCGEIVDQLTLAQATVSQHLKVLKDAGLISG